MRTLLVVSLFVLVLAPAAHAQQKSIRFAAGYAFAHYLEEDGTNTPLGLYVAVQGLQPVALKAELAYHHHSEDLDYFSFTLNTFTGMLGPVINFSSGGAQPFLHLLVGGREDRVEGEGNFSVGGELGAGVDLQAGEKVFIRPGVDFQVFNNDGNTFKVLRISAGIAW
jgi:hypothetical protein